MAYAPPRSYTVKRQEPKVRSSHARVRLAVSLAGSTQGWRGRTDWDAVLVARWRCVLVLAFGVFATRSCRPLQQQLCPHSQPCLCFSTAQNTSLGIDPHSIILPHPISMFLSPHMYQTSSRGSQENGLPYLQHVQQRRLARVI